VYVDDLIITGSSREEI
jgi:hypothetical protein